MTGTATTAEIAKVVTVASLSGIIKNRTNQRRARCSLELPRPSKPRKPS